MTNRGLCSSSHQILTLSRLNLPILSGRLPTGWKKCTSTIVLNKSAFIELAPGEGLLFFDSLSPPYPLYVLEYENPISTLARF